MLWGLRVYWLRGSRVCWFRVLGFWGFGALEMWYLWVWGVESVSMDPKP